MTEAIDLRKTGAYFRPLPVTPVHQRTLRLAVLRAIKPVPGCTRDILSAYSPDPVHWEVPPLYCGKLCGVELQICPEEIYYKLNESAIDFYKLAIGVYMESGWASSLRSLLTSRMGPNCLHPAVFTTTGSNLDRFIVELVVAMSTQYPINRLEGDNTLALKVPDGDDFTYIGIVDDEVLHTDIELEKASLLTMLISPRGLVIPKTYGAYDRTLLWVEQNYGEVEDADKLRYALALLKLSSELDGPFDRGEVMFEAELRKLKTAPPVLKQGADSPLNYEKFAEIRDMWVGASSERQDEGFLNLFEALVPDVFDSEKFIKLFGSLPDLRKKLTKAQSKRIDKGIEKFTDFYIRMERGAK